MANQALARLETALRARKLDRTLTTALPPFERHDESALIATGIAALDASLRGGLPRGQLSEIVGAPSSGCTTLVLQTIAASTRRGEIAALVDTFDRLDVASAADAGVDLDRLLWVRGLCHLQSSNFNLKIADLKIAHALKALNLVLQAGGFACVVLDLSDAPSIALRRVPFTTWLRVQRVIEGSDTVCVLAVPQPVARSAGGLTLLLSSRTRWTGDAERNRHLTGADINIRIASPRRRVDGEITVRAGANDRSLTTNHGDTEARRYF
jgi:recombination protein RecA